MNQERSDGVTHIFRGIPEGKFNPEADPQKNLETLQADFARLGININADCNIANSTLRKLIKTVNATLSPDRELPPEIEKILDGVKIGEPGKRIAEDLIDSKEKLNFNIIIEAGVRVGEDVEFGTSIFIGEKTRIGDNVHISTGTTIGKFCDVGSGVFFQHDCSIGNNTSIENLTTFMPRTEVPDNSKVVHENDNSTMAKIEQRLRIV